MEDENKPTVRAPSEPSASQPSPTAPVFTQQPEPELNLLTSESLPPAPKDAFAERSWHAPYAAALMAGASDKDELIATAERAIFNRHLEILIHPSSTEEGLDLQRAIEVLAELRKPVKVRHDKGVQ